MATDTLTNRGGAAMYLSIAVIFTAVALSLAWLQVEGVISPAASQIVTLGVGAVIVILVLRLLELYADR